MDIIMFGTVMILVYRFGEVVACNFWPAKGEEMFLR